MQLEVITIFQYERLPRKTVHLTGKWFLHAASVILALSFSMLYLNVAFTYSYLLKCFFFLILYFYEKRNRKEQTSLTFK